MGTDIGTPAHALLNVSPNPNVVRILLFSDLNSDSTWAFQIPAKNTGSPDKGGVSFNLPGFNGGRVRS
jgi:hypothetical protein